MSRDRERGSRVFIGHLPRRADKRDIEKFFKGFGRIQDIHLKQGYAFIVSVYTVASCLRFLSSDSNV